MWFCKHLQLVNSGIQSPHYNIDISWNNNCCIFTKVIEAGPTGGSWLATWILWIFPLCTKSKTYLAFLA